MSGVRSGNCVVRNILKIRQAERVEKCYGFWIDRGVVEIWMGRC